MITLITKLKYKHHKKNKYNKNVKGGKQNGNYKSKQSKF